MDSFVLAVQLALAAIFVTAAIAKLLDRPGTRASLEGFGVSSRAAAVWAPLLPAAELAVAIALIPASTARWGAVGAAALLLTFCAGIANAMRKGRTPDCNCFGSLHSAPAGRMTLARNLAFVVLAGFLILQGPDTEVGDWVSARTTAELAAVGIGLAALALAAACWRLWRQNRGLRHQIHHLWKEAQEEPEPEPDPEGLPVGTPAPTFELSTLGGETRTLEALRSGGRPVLLVFMDPNCGPCHGLSSHVARWQAALDDRVAIAVVSLGGHHEVQPLWADTGAEVLLDPGPDVHRAYKVRTWPSAIGIGRDGAVAHQIVYSQDVMEAEIRTMLEEAARSSSPSRPAGGAKTSPATARVG